MNSLRYRLMAAVLGLLFVWAAVDTLLNLAALQEASKRHGVREVEVVARSVHAGIRSAMTSARKDLLHTTMAVICKNPDFVKLRLLDSRGRIISSGDSTEIGEVVKPPPASVFTDPDHLIPPRPNVIDGRRATVVYRPMRLERDCRTCHTDPEDVKAALEIAILSSQTESLAAEMQSTLILSAGIVFVVVGAVLWFAMRYVIVKPLRELEASMALVEAGDLSVRVRAGSDEIGRLAAQFNVMVTRLGAMRRELEETHARELERADRLATVGELAAGVAHEIKNPLAGISGAIEVIAGDLPRDHSNREVFAEILDQIRRIDKTLRDLLSFARLSAPVVRPCDFNELVRSRMSLLRRAPGQQDVDVTLDLADRLPAVEIDEDQMGQVLVNLCLNALYAAAPGGRVRVSSRLDASLARVFLVVEDSGPGIPPQRREEVFRPFVTTKPKGTGLGLSISRRIARAHRGDLVVEESTDLGGARFVLHIPLPENAPTGDIE